MNFLDKYCIITLIYVRGFKVKFLQKGDKRFESVVQKLLRGLGSRAYCPADQGRAVNYKIKIHRLHFMLARFCSDAVHGRSFTSMPSNTKEGENGPVSVDPSISLIDYHHTHNWVNNNFNYYINVIG